ncbi:uncharacterized protein LOC113348546 isoform X1 [Papaver somniferum]|uniref:uncharacterized protein LOC113348546 isoform X1 n=1 Tax=Papaver somniferum TaxID=3469 RepID=UPI000E6FB147|nr:uncharacterized protein LOC113348546 isoform X1 [Papaver somniferum]
MSFLARRTASVEGAYFYQESKLAVSRLVEKNKKNNPNFASPLNSSISVVENETQADVLPEILKHSLPLKISEPFSESSTTSTASKWNLPRDVSKVHSLSTEAINPFGSYIALPQVTLGPKRWLFPEGENSVFASTANDLRTDRYNIYGDAENLKAISAGISQIGASFAIATVVVFGGAALAFGITASKLDIHNGEDIKTKGKDLLQPKFDGVRDQLVPVRIWAENKSKGWRTGMDKQVQENRLVKELSKNLGLKESN